MIRRPPRSPLFPSPTLFRSTVRDGRLPHLHDLPAAAQRLANRRHGPRRDAPSRVGRGEVHHQPAGDRKSTRLNSSHSQISYAVFCLKKKNKRKTKSGPPTQI